MNQKEFNNSPKQPLIGTHTSFDARQIAGRTCGDLPAAVCVSRAALRWQQQTAQRTKQANSSNDLVTISSALANSPSGARTIRSQNTQNTRDHRQTASNIAAIAEIERSKGHSDEVQQQQKTCFQCVLFLSKNLSQRISLSIWKNAF